MDVRMPPMPVMASHGRFARRIGGRLNPESATDPAENTANDAADNDSNGSCCLITDRRAMRNAIGDALCLRRKRASK
jgi:hypothetical protein